MNSELMLPIFLDHCWVLQTYATRGIQL